MTGYAIVPSEQCTPYDYINDKEIASGISVRYRLTCKTNHRAKWYQNIFLHLCCVPGAAYKHWRPIEAAILHKVIKKTTGDKSTSACVDMSGNSRECMSSLVTASTFTQEFGSKSNAMHNINLLFLNAFISYYRQLKFERLAFVLFGATKSMAFC